MNLDNKPTSHAPKRLGELLVDSGILLPDNLQTGLDYGQKTSLPIGRVLVMLRLVDDQQVRAALHVQTLMKFESMPGALAVKALTLVHQERISIEDACCQLGWSSEKFKAGLPPRLRELKNALADAEQRLGPAHPELASILMQMADFYESESMWPHAEAHMETAIAILERKYGATDLRVAHALTKLAALLFLQDRFQESHAIYDRVLKIRQDVLGGDDPDVGFAWFDLGEIMDVQHRWPDAENHYLKALKILETLYECDDPVILELLHRLSYVCRRRNAPVEPMLVGALLTESGLLPAEKLPEALAYSKQNGMPLGRALVALDYMNEAQLRTVLHGQLLIKVNLLPPQLAIRAVRLRSKLDCSLETAIEKTGWRMHSARSHELYELLEISDALIDAEKTLSADDPQIAALCARMAEIFESYERFGDAEPLYKRAIGILEKNSDEVDGLTSLLDRLGYVSIQQKKFEQADTIYKRALELRILKLGDEHFDLADSYVNLGRLHSGKGDHKEAVAYLQKALPLVEKQYGQEHIEVAHVVEQLASEYFEIGDHIQAEPLFWRAYKIKRVSMDNQSEEIVILLTKLADMYNKDGKYTMAESVLVLFQENRSVTI